MNPAPRPGRNPFGVRDAPDPNGRDVEDFAATFARLRADADADDPNAPPWPEHADAGAPGDSIEGPWCSRWNGGADPAVPDDRKENWKPGHAKLAIDGGRVYILFDWHHGTRQALIDARRNGAHRLVGRYINLGNPEITRPWVGLIVDNRRIDGRWTNGRLDFRR